MEEQLGKTRHGIALKGELENPEQREVANNSFLQAENDILQAPANLPVVLIKDEKSAFEIPEQRQGTIKYFLEAEKDLQQEPANLANVLINDEKIELGVSELQSWDSLTISNQAQRMYPTKKEETHLAKRRASKKPHITPEQRAKQNAKDRERMAWNRKNETFEQRAKRLAKLRERWEHSKQIETPEQREQRRAKNREFMRARRKALESEKNEKLLARQCLQTRIARLNENTEKSEERLTKKQQRKNGTLELREKRSAETTQLMRRKVEVEMPELGKETNNSYMEAEMDITQELSNLPIVVIKDEKKTIVVGIKQSDVQ